MTERYESPTALRRALETRLKQQATDTGTDLARRRRLVVFDRVAARLSADRTSGWVLKGGAALEFRLRNKARTTKDMDLATCPDSDQNLDGPTARELLIDALSLDEDSDAPRDIEAVDRRQHFAEKLHALTRDYGARPNTRVKDLVDLVLLIETGLVADTSLAAAVRHVFMVRATHEVPEVLASPPPAWADVYPELAAGLTETPPVLSVALDRVSSFWSVAQRKHVPPVTP